MMRHLSRRRFICIAAAAAGLELVPLRPGAHAQTHLVTWRGVALGAVATMQVHHPDRAVAEHLVEACIREVRRLERIFSLYRDDSRLVALNRRGVLEAPPPELVELLGESRRYAEATGGAFDPTVQSLWALYADHFSRPDADPGGPPARAIETALGKGQQHRADGADGGGFGGVAMPSRIEPRTAMMSASAGTRATTTSRSRCCFSASGTGVAGADLGSVTALNSIQRM